MNITDELREWAKDNTLQDIVLTTYPPQHAVHGVLETLLAIADRIDAEHESKVGCTADEWAYWESTHVELPKDADGEYIHIGDVMVSKDGNLHKVDSLTRNPIWFDYEWSIRLALLNDGVGAGSLVRYRPDTLRHYHAPTVEDVLREMADRCYADEDEPRDRDAIVAEYAAKLQLREDA